MKVDADIDIDFADRNNVLAKIEYRAASLKTGKPHNTGVYVTEIPHNPIDNLATIDYKAAGTRGYYKLDFLNVHVYDNIKSPQHYEKLLADDIPWHRLHQLAFVKQIIHINKYAGTLAALDVNSINKLAMFLAMIRPGKKHLIGKPWSEVELSIWDKTSDGYIFKKSHSFSYAMLVGLHMKIINEQENLAK